MNDATRWAVLCACVCALSGCDFDLDALRDRARDGAACRGAECTNADAGDAGKDGGDTGDDDHGSGGKGASGSSGSGGKAGSGGKSGSGGKADSGAPDEPDLPDTGKCLADHGGCDGHANCIEADDPDDDPRCACRSGYTGDGVTCDAALESLGLSSGTILPALDPGVTTYDIAVPIGTEHLVFTPAAASGVTIVFNDDAVVESGTDWQSPLLELGFNTFSATLQLAGRPDRAYRFNVTRGKQEAYLKGDMLGLGAGLGSDVALARDTVVVGAPGRALGAASVSGSAYVFVRDGVTYKWKQQARLIADAPVIGDNFGAAVAIAGDTILVGATTEDAGAGAVYVFTRSGDTWSKQARLAASNAGEGDAFGSDVAFSGDTAVIGASFEDGSQVSVSATAPADDGAESAGAAYVFTRAGDSWSERAYLKGSTTAAGDGFGRAVAIGDSGDGETYSIAVGAASSSGAQAGDGAVYVYRGSGASWTEEAALPSPSPTAEAGGYGYYATGLDVDGDWLAVGAPEDGAQGRVYLFHHASDGAWQPGGTITSSPGSTDDYFGIAVAISGRTLVVGASGEDSSGSGIAAAVDELATDAGAVYVFGLEDDFLTWSQRYYIKAAIVAGGHSRFGSAVAIAGGAIAVGSAAESGGAHEVDGDPSNTGQLASGAAYVIR
jgi:hypothetical protein